MVERAGVLNLGIEGMMIMGAACGFAGAYMSGSTLIGALCGIVAGAALSAVFAILTLGLAVNQVAAGLALTILGVGLSGLIGAGFVGEQIVPVPHLQLPVLTDLPFIGRIVFGEDPFVYVSIALIIAIWLFLYRTRTGLVLRAIGDNHASVGSRWRWWFLLPGVPRAWSSAPTCSEPSASWGWPCSRSNSAFRSR